MNYPCGQPPSPHRDFAKEAREAALDAPSLYKRPDGMWCINVNVTVGHALSVSIACVDRNRKRLLDTWCKQVCDSLAEGAYKTSREMDCEQAALKSTHKEPKP